jgi:pre-mRNA-splicing factor CWC22
LHLFEESFAKYYDTIHHYETNRLRNIVRFFGHMLALMSFVGMCFTTSSTYLHQDIFSRSRRAPGPNKIDLGLPKLQERVKGEILQPSFDGLFPT